MTCSDVGLEFTRAARKPASDLSAEVRRHLEACVHCRKVWEFLGGSSEPDPAVDEERPEITRAITESLEPVTPVPGSRLLTLGFLLIFGSLSAAFVAWSGIRGTAAMGWAQFAGVLGIVGAAAFLLALTLSREMVPGEKRLVTPARMFLLSLVPLFLAVFLLFPWESGSDPAPQSWHCFRAGCLFSLPAAGLVVLVFRRGAVLSLGVVGAGAGLLAGLVGVVVLHFGCGIPNAPHIALAHLGVPMLGAVIGGLMGRGLRLMGPWHGN